VFPKSIQTLRHDAFGTCYIKYKGKIPVNLLNNTVITETKKTADTLGSTISYNSSSRHYSTNFLPHKTAAEKQDIQFPPADKESYNLPISLSELENSLNAAHDSSPGPDYIFITNF